MRLVLVHEGLGHGSRHLGITRRCRRGRRFVVARCGLLDAGSRHVALEDASVPNAMRRLACSAALHASR